MRWIVPVAAILLAGCAADPLEDAENSYFALKREGVTGQRLCDAARRIRDEQRSRRRRNCEGSRPVTIEYRKTARRNRRSQQNRNP